MNMLPAYEIAKGDTDIVIGVLDTGIDINHSDLAKNIYVNKKEIPGNGIDDDGNGYVDDVNGWDFNHSDNSVFDSSESDLHGTYVAGVIAAIEDDKGIIGVAPNVTILPLKFIDGFTGYTCDAIAAIEYAKNMGVKVINCSFGGTDNNPALKDAMENSGILFVCAAGNRGGDSTDYPVYPASYDIPNVISVAAIDTMGILASFSNRGKQIDVAAPGVHILSTIPENGYDYYSGTSVASANVSGVIGLMLSKDKSLSNNQIKENLLSTVTKCDALIGVIGSEGRVDAYGALTNQLREPDPYQGEGALDDDLIHQGEGEGDAWYTMDQLSRIKERLHYGESGVNPASGNFSVTCTDMSVPSIGFQVNFSRTYNSKNEKSTLLGRGWSFGFEGKSTGQDLVEITLPDGSAHRFRKNGLEYKSEDTRAIYIRNADGSGILTTLDQYTYGFDVSGRMVSMKDKCGNKLQITYNNNQITSIWDSVGRNYNIGYNSLGLIENITDMEGRKVRYEYEDALLMRVIDPEGNVTKYGYNSKKFLTNMYDSSGELIQTLSYDYTIGDSQDKVISSSDALGDAWNYQYDMINRKTTITNSKNRKWTYWFDTSMYTIKIQNPLGLSTTTYYTYENGRNVYGDVYATTDINGGITKYEYDARGNVTKVIQPDGSTKQYEYDEKNNITKEINEAGAVTWYEYDSNKVNLLKKVEALGFNLNYQPDTSEIKDFAITIFDYYSKEEANKLFSCNVSGLLKSTTDPSGILTKCEYNKYGDISATIDGNGNRNKNTYNTIGWILSQTTPRGEVTKYQYNNNGMLVKTIQPDGGEIRSVYNTAGKLIKQFEPNQVGEVPSVEYSYYSNGLLKENKDALGNITSYTYDIYGNLEKETRPNGSSYRYEYDALDRLTATYFKDSEASFEVLLLTKRYSELSQGKSQLTETVYLNEYEGAETTSVYDYAGKVLSILYPDRTIVQNSYREDGVLLETIAQNGAISRYSYDIRGNKVQSYQPVEIKNGTIYYAYEGYDYNKSGKLTTHKKGKSLVSYDQIPEEVVTTSTIYSDLTGLEITNTDSEGRREDLFYDCNGNILKKLQLVEGNRTKETRYEYNTKGKPSRVIELIEANSFAENSLENKEKIEISSTYQYDLNDNLISYQDAGSNVITYEYDALNRKIRESKQVTKEDGREVTIQVDTTYDWNGKVVTETKPYEKGTKANIKISYEYDKAGNKVKYIDPLRNITAYQYDRAGRLVREVQPKNYVADKSIKEMEHTEYVYDNCNRLAAKVFYYNNYISMVDGTWTTKPVRVVSEAYQYDALGNVKKKLSAGGILAASGELKEQITSGELEESIAAGDGVESSYYLNGSIASYLDSESKAAGYQYTVRYQYNGLGQMIQQMHADGTKLTYDYDGAGNVLSTYVNGIRKSSGVYNKLSQMVQSTDANGNRTVFEWNLLGKQSRVYFPSDPSIEAFNVVHQYDKMGNLTRTKDSTGLVTVMTYNQRGQMLSQTRQNTDASEQIRVHKTYDINGNVASETDANGTKVNYTYDALNQMIAKQTTGQINKVTTYTYDANGNKTSETDWLGNRTTFRYDGINRLIETKDSFGNVVSQLEYNTDNVQTASYDVYGNCTSYEYDKNLRLIKTVDPYRYETTNSYDVRGNLITKTDQNKNVTNYRYNSEQALTQVVNALNEQTSYTYDANGNRLTMTDGRGYTTTYRYKARNLLIEKIDPGKEKTSELYSYHADGNIATKTDRNKKETSYRYDCFGRVIYESIGNQYKEYTYDKIGNVLTAKDNTSDITRVYDSMGRVTNKTVKSLETTTGITTETTTYRYDITTGLPSGMVLEEAIDPKGNSTLKIYDQVGRLYQVYADKTVEQLNSSTSGSEAVTYLYYPNGSRKSVTYPNGGKETYTYTKKNQILQLKNLLSDDTILQCYTYAYDPAGNQISKEEAGSEAYPGLTLYTYDSLNRLKKVQETTGNILSYEYDKSGNRTMELSQSGLNFIRTSYDYDERNRLANSITLSHTDATKKIEYSMTDYSYDKNGNLLQKKTEYAESTTEDQLKDLTKLPKFGMKKISEFNSSSNAGSTVGATEGTIAGTTIGTDYLTRYSYDNFNRMISSSLKGSNILYQYNAEDYRIQKSVNGEVIRYLYEADQVILELNDNGEEIGRNVYGTNLIYREALSENNTEAYYYLYNAHGDVTGLLKQNGTMAATYCYDAFGNLLSKRGQANNTITYAGYQYDAETELYYLNARYYDSKIARFLTEDTYGGEYNDPLSLNRYTYCANNPIRYIDPTGHWGTDVHGKKTSEILKEEFTQYIKEESKNIVIYKTDKKGNVLVDKKGKQIIDDKKTKSERSAWVKDQNKKVDGYVKAIVAGDLYVDQENTVFQRKDFASDNIFHGMTIMYTKEVKKERENKKNTLFVEERKNTAITILTSNKYNKKGAITEFIIEPGIDMLRNSTKAQDSSISSINKDIKNGKFEEGSATTYLTGKNATKESAALFVFGMGMHSLQDQQAHGNLTNARDHIAWNDDPTYDSWKYDVKQGEIVGTKGNQRITNTEEDTRDYINDFLYGNDSTPGAGSFLFQPSKYSLTKSK